MIQPPTHLPPSIHKSIPNTNSVLLCPPPAAGAPTPSPHPASHRLADHHLPPPLPNPTMAASAAHHLLLRPSATYPTFFPIPAARHRWICHTHRLPPLDTSTMLRNHPPLLPTTHHRPMAEAVPPPPCCTAAHVQAAATPSSL